MKCFIFAHVCMLKVDKCLFNALGIFWPTTNFLGIFRLLPAVDTLSEHWTWDRTDIQFDCAEGAVVRSDFQAQDFLNFSLNHVMPMISSEFSDLRNFPDDSRFSRTVDTLTMKWIRLNVRSLIYCWSAYIFLIETA